MAIWYRVTVVHSGGTTVMRNYNNGPARALHAVIDEIQQRQPGVTIVSTNVIPDPVEPPTVP